VIDAELHVRRSGRRILLVAALAFVPFAACGDDGETETEGTSGPTSMVPLAEDPAAEAEYVGLDLEAAGAKADLEGRPWRVIREDGVDLAVTFDFVEDRLNFVVEDGTVVEVTTG
jgi:hypothetical protein